MIRKTVAGLGVLGLLVLPVSAAQVDGGGVYCFSPDDFYGQELQGICLTQLPEQTPGVLALGDRLLREGDVLTREQLEQVTFRADWQQEDGCLTVGYLPVLPEGLGQEATMTLSIRGRENQAPAAEDFALETYKNLPVEGSLKVSDPEGEAMTYQLVRQSKRGTVELQADGSFTYTPKNNKVGVDSFVYTATDARGQVSREATVTVTILKPTQGRQYTDTVGLECRFAAEWMKNTGIFVGEQVDGNPCFQPDQPVTRGEFTAMLVKALDLMEEDAALEAQVDDQVPDWLRPYVAAAIRSGLTASMPEQGSFDTPITGEEAAVMVQNHLELPVTADAPEGTPLWAQEAVAAIGTGYPLSSQTLTRGEAAMLLYWAQSQ